MTLSKKILISFVCISFLVPIGMYINAADDSLCIREPDNPECGGGAKGNDIFKFLNNIINFLTALGGALGVLLLVIAGFYFVTAQGDEKKLGIARNMVLWVVIGMAIVFLARLFIGVVAQLAGS